MFDEIDLKKLAKLTSHDRAFLSIYLSSPESLEIIERRIDNIRKLFKENKDESKHFEENIKLVKDYLDKDLYQSGSLCIFCCWLLDYFEAYPLNVTVENIIWVDSSPYIRPLAELKDEYENFAVVVADNEIAKIFLVTSAKADSEEKIKGNIKNRVKVGGWSQQRYERRRDKKIQYYSREIVDRLIELEKKEEFRRIILVGSKKILTEIRSALTNQLTQKLVGEKALDLRKGENYINKEIFDLFFIEERKSEKKLWEEIKNHYLRGEPAVVGVDDVLFSSKMGRVEKVIVNRDVEINGIRCRDCEGLFNRELDKCPDCGSTSLFKVDLINEIVELLSTTKAEVDFVDEIEELKDVGDIAALLRY
ncbi:MAG: host attachment protein [Deltaproteobacteria bacterium]|nr:MAG: host attachment protein [Deltaproteobacteria bacterium]